MTTRPHPTTKQLLDQFNTEPDYSDASQDDAEALSRDRIPVRSLTAADFDAVVRQAADIAPYALTGAVFANVAAAVAKGEEVSINGFGKFKVKDAPERQGRNPATGEAITIAAQRKLTFAPAKQVRDRMNGN